MSSINDELVSQFLMITGSEDTDRATSYLEMCAGNLEQAVSLFMDHTQAGGASAAGGAGGDISAGVGMGMGSDDSVRAPDATRTMRLMDFGDPGDNHHHQHLPMMMGGGFQEQLQRSAFSDPSPGFFDVRQAINLAAATAANEDGKEDHVMDDSATSLRNNTNSSNSNNNLHAYDVDDDDDDIDYIDSDGGGGQANGQSTMARLADMFAPPEHLIYREGGFEGARNMAKDSKRWLLVNIQKDSEFSCHALNRDVWRDELVENLVREGFIFWQSMDIAPEGQVYSQRYHVHDYPHIAIIDPRTRRLMWKKEGWTQENPMTAALFAETAMDFCSRHSFDKPPQAPRPPGAAKLPAKRPMHQMSEEEQLQAAMRASLEEASNTKPQSDQNNAANAGDDDNDDDNSDYIMEDNDDDGDDDDIQYLGTSEDGDFKPKAEEETKEPEPRKLSLLEQLLAMPLAEEPTSGARIQLRMPDGKRSVRKFDASLTVRSIYAYIAQSNEEAKGGKEFVLMAGFPPKDLITEIDNTIDSCQLNGQAITIRWK